MTAAKGKMLAAMGIFGTVGIFVRYLPLSSPAIAFCRAVLGLVFLLIVMACEVYAHIGRARAAYLPTVAALYGIVLLLAALFKRIDYLVQ